RVPRERPRPAARRPGVSEPRPDPTRDGVPRGCARECLRHDRLAVGRPLDFVARLPALLADWGLRPTAHGASLNGGYSSVTSANTAAPPRVAHPPPPTRKSTTPRA